MKKKKRPELLRWRRPETSFRLGLIRAEIWDIGNESEAIWCVSISRDHRDGDQRNSTAAFRAEDLPTVTKTWDMACAWIRALLQATPEDEPSV
jgi:hypothetical protein